MCVSKFTVRGVNVICFYGSVCFSLRVYPVIGSQVILLKQGNRKPQDRDHLPSGLKTDSRWG